MCHAAGIDEKSERDTRGQPFDLGRLTDRVEQARAERGLSMKALALAVGVSASTIRRMRSADDAEADGVLALLGWLGDPPEDFISDSVVAGVSLPPTDNGMIRVDMHLVNEVSSNQRRGTRTTIQRLAAIAQESGRTIASLTRWSRH